MVTQDEILDAVWSETHVNPEVLRKYILEIRKTLGDRHDKPEFIETVPKRGYRFVADVTGEWEKLSGEALAYYVVGRREEADKALEKLIATHQGDSAYQIAEIYAFRGEINKAFEWLDRAYRQRDPGLPELKTSPLMKSLRQDPRYTELLKKLRLPI